MIREGSPAAGTSGLRSLLSTCAYGDPARNDATNLDRATIIVHLRQAYDRDGAPMRIEKFSFGHITIDGVTYDHDVVIDHGKVRKRVKKPSKNLRSAFAHTPLSPAEEIPWHCRRLVIGTGAYGNLPVTDDVKREAARRELELVILPTVEAIKALQTSSRRTNAVLHVTC